MTADEFRTALKELGMSQRELRVRLGLNKSTVSRWAMGEIKPVPQYAVEYLSLVKKYQALVDFV